MQWIYDDGGRAAAGYRGHAGDCAVRAIAIAAGVPYRDAYDAINTLARNERPRNGRPRSSAREGVWRHTMDRYMTTLGWRWHPAMTIGSGCRVHLRTDELPGGRLIVRVSKHWTAVMDGVIRDTIDPSRDGTRCVYGWWTPEGQ